MTERRRDERGLTIPELMISIVILSLIVGPLAAAMMFFLQNGETSNAIFQDDATARLAATHFTADVQSATSVTVDDVAGCGTGTALASLRWQEDAVEYVASWFARADARGSVLERRSCTDGVETAVSEIGRLTPTAVPEITCAPSCATPGSVELRVSAADGFAFTTVAAPRASAP